MNAYRTIGLSLILAVFAVGCAADETGTEAEDEAAIRSLLERQLDAWSAGDGAAFGATYTIDGDLIAFDGTHVAGREEIIPFMQAQFDGFLKDTLVSAQPEQIRFVSDGVAIMITEGGVMFPGETEVPLERFSIQTFVATKLEGEDDWLFAAFQNTRIAPLEANAARQGTVAPRSWPRRSSGPAGARHR